VFSLLPAANDIELDVAPPLDYGVSAQKMASYAAGMSVRYQVSRRSSLNVTAGTGSQRLLDDNYDVKTLGYGGAYSYSVSRYASLRLGYRAQVSDYPGSPMGPRRRYNHRNIDAGVNYARPLSVSRRTTLSFGTGSAILDNELETYYTVTGNASLNHQIGRTWIANVVYVRGLSIVGGFTEPFFADAVNANLQGYLSRHVMLLTSAGFSNGAVGLGSAANNYDSFQATTRLEWALKNDRIGVYANYFYQGYRFDEPPPSATPIPSKVDRHGVSAGLIFRIPLLRERMPRVTR
jgi:hypothetical protein